jgi:hypothetical protein
MTGELGMFGPRDRDLARAVHHAHSVEPVPAESERIDVQQCQLAKCPWRQRVAAGLVTRDGPLLDDGDVVARLGQPVSD